MNNFKKVLSLLLVAFLAVVLVGCSNKAEEAAKEELNENLEQIYVTGLEDALSDITLPKYFKGDKKKTITWTSDSEYLVVTEFDDNNANKAMYYRGQVVLAVDAHNFKLTATLTYEYEDGKTVTGSKEFSGNIVADDWANNSYATIAEAKSSEGKTSNESKIKFSGTVTFTTDSGYVVSDNTASIYVYGSTHGRKVGEIVTVRGVWATYNNMPQVATGSAAQVDGTDTTMTYETIAEEKTVAEIFALKTQKVDAVNTTKFFKTVVIAQNIPASTYNSYKFVDPADSNKYVEVSKYNSSDTLTEVAGLVNGKAYTVYVVIYCSRSAEGDGVWDVLYIPGTAVETTVELTDEQIINNSLAAAATQMNAEYYGNTEVTLATSESNVALSYEVVEGSTALSIVDGKLVVNCQNEEVVGKVKITGTYGNTTAETVVTIKVGAALKQWITVTEALAICNALEDGKTTDERYFVYGTVVSVYNEQYCNFTLTDGTNNITVYGLYTEDGSKKHGTKDDTFTGIIPVKAGEVVFLNTKIQKYVKSGTVTPELVYAWLQPTQHDGLQIMTPMNATDAYELAATLDGSKKETTTKEYYILATVNDITNETYCNFNITDGTNSLLVYGLYTADGSKKYGTKDDTFTGTIPVKAGGTVLLLAKIQNYNGTYELKDAKLLEFTEATEVKEPQLTNPDAKKEYTVEEILAVMADYADNTTSKDMFIVKGKVISSSYNETYKSYTIDLEGPDGTKFQLYSVALDESITEDYTAKDALVGATVVCTGYIKLFKGTYEMPYLGSSPSGDKYTPVVSSVTK